MELASENHADHDVNFMIDARGESKSAAASQAPA